LEAEPNCTLPMVGRYNIIRHKPTSVFRKNKRRMREDGEIVVPLRIDLLTLADSMDQLILNSTRVDRCVVSQSIAFVVASLRGVT